MSHKFTERIIRIICMLMIVWLSGSKELNAQPAQDLFELYDWGETPADLFADVYQTTNGDYLICGQRVYEPWLLRVDRDGNRLWSYTESGARLFSVIEADNGDAVSTGTIGEDFLYGVIRVDQEGELLWSRSFGDGRGTAIIELKEGDFIACGGVEGRGYMNRLDGDGRQIWGVGINCLLLQSMRETDGGVVAVGHTAGSRGFAVKVDLEGDIVWSRIYPLNGGRNPQYFASVVSIPDGFAIGGFYAVDHQGFSITKINPQGEVLNQDLLNLGDGQYWFESIDKMSDGGFVLAGYTTAGYDFPYIVRVDRESNILWSYDWADSVNQRPRQRNEHNQLYSVIVTNDNEITACGTMMNMDINKAGDGFLVRFEPDTYGPIIIYTSPDDSIINALPGDSIRFVVVARSRDRHEIEYQWRIGDTELGTDTVETIQFDEFGEFPISCVVSSQNVSVEVDWEVHVTDLFISVFTPDTLNLTLRRGSEVDFAIDEVRYSPGGEPEYNWTKTDLNSNQSEDLGQNSHATIDFPWSGDFTVEGKVSRDESSDNVIWNVAVRGAIWAYVPEALAFDIEPESVVRFEVAPSEPENESLSIQWLVDGEVAAEDTVALEWRFGQVENLSYQVAVVVADSVEADTVTWDVTVRDLGVGEQEEVGQAGTPVLLSVSPNPFNSMLTIRYAGGLDKSAPTRLAIYDLSGREIADLPDRQGRLSYRAGGKITPPTPPTPPAIAGGDRRTVVWNASSVPTGVYLVRLENGGEVATRKVVLMR